MGRMALCPTAPTADNHYMATMPDDQDDQPGSWSIPRGPGGLWDAIVVKITLKDPAGSGLVGPSWPDQPNGRELGMFDFVPVGAEG